MIELLKGRFVKYFSLIYKECLKEGENNSITLVFIHLVLRLSISFIHEDKACTERGPTDH